MSTVSLADAQSRLDALIDQVTAGDTVTITLQGRAIARLISVDHEPRKPVDIAALRTLTAALPFQTEGAATFIRSMRDGTRF